MSETEELRIEPMTADDWPDVRSIYLEGIATGNATFEQSAPEWEIWDAAHLKECRIVARLHDGLVGWAALTPVSGRCVYAGVAEVSVYVAERMRGRKIGQRLLASLIEESEKHGIWTLQAGIFPENTASIGAHKRCGFRVVGTREKLGRMNGVWRDVILMERRSKLL
jgi:phosphinothricin acetyltransferase